MFAGVYGDFPGVEPSSIVLRRQRRPIAVEHPGSACFCGAEPSSTTMRRFSWHGAAKHPAYGVPHGGVPSSTRASRALRPSAVERLSQVHNTAVCIMINTPRSFLQGPVPSPSTPGNLCDATRPSPEPPVQTAPCRATPCCAPLWQATAACWGHRHRRERGAAAGGQRGDAPVRFLLEPNCCSRIA